MRQPPALTNNYFFKNSRGVCACVGHVVGYIYRWSLAALVSDLGESPAL